MLTLLLCVAFLPVALYTFWVLFGVVAQACSGSRTAGAGRCARVPFRDLSASGLAYLIQDRIALLGGARARRVLREKAHGILGAGLPQTGHFVQLHSAGAWRRAGHPDVDDIGWLFLDPERLLFVGDVQQVTMPRALVAGVRRGPDLSSVGLGGPWVDLTLRFPDGAGGRLRLLSRDADRLSATGDSARTLGRALNAWLSAPPA